MMNVSITEPELQKMVEEKVRKGEYDSPEAVVAAALSLMQDDDALTPEQIDSLRQQINIGAQQADRGEFANFTAEDIIQREMKALKSKRERNGN